MRVVQRPGWCAPDVDHPSAAPEPGIDNQLVTKSDGLVLGRDLEVAMLRLFVIVFVILAIGAVAARFAT
jgi:hypothetical protein